MPIRNSKAVTWRAKGLTDSRDGTNSFAGAMKRLINLIPDPSTQGLWVCRPAAALLAALDLDDPGIISCALVVGDILYGLAPSSLNPGFDEPFAYDLATGTFLTVSGINSGNVPASPATSGDWVPPIMCQIAGRVIVTHPGFPGGDVSFGWFDVSNAAIAALGDTVSGTRYITGNPNLLGVQPGDTVTGTGIPASTTVVNTHPYYLGFDFTGDTHSSTLIDGIADTTDIKANLFIAGQGILPGTKVIAVHANSIDISQATTSSVAALTIQCFGNNVLQMTPPADAFGDTHSNTIVDGIFPINTLGEPLGAAVGQGVSGDGILPLTTVASVGPGNQITLSQAAASSVTGVFLAFDGATIVLSANTTATNDGVAFTIAGGTRTAPLWGAGNTDNFPLPSKPVGVAQMNGRAWYALGLDGIVYSDSGLPCRVSNTLAVQALTTNDGLAVTAIGQLQLGVPLTGGIVQGLVAFEGVNKLQQITGDQATGNLAMNVLPEATGTDAPLSIVPVGGARLAFVSPLGLRFVGIDGSISQPVGVDGQGITDPFQFAVNPSRICAAYNVGVLRITVKNGLVNGTPAEEYWYDLPRSAWHGPHTFPARLIQPWRSTFVEAPLARTAELWQSDAFATLTSGYTENGYPMSFFAETVLLPDNASMAMNAVVEGDLMCAASSTLPIQVTAFDEIGALLAVAEPIAPNAGNEAVRQRATNWDRPLIFKQMSVRMTGLSGRSVRLGNLYQRYEVLGYNIDEAAGANFWLLSSRRPYPILLADDGTTGLIPG